MTIETERDLEALRAIGQIVARTLKYMQDRLEPGMTTLELDALGRAHLEALGARSAPESVYGFPGATCISINNEAAHGIPGPRVVQPGDLVNIDVSAEMDGYFGDTGGSAIVPPDSPEKLRLCHATRQALAAAMAVARAGAPLNGIGRAIEQTAKHYRYKVIRNLCSHGVGRTLHDDPSEIPGYYDARDKRVLREGMVITIEPFLSTRASFVDEAEDGWTLVAPAGNLSAQYEHTMVITASRPIVLTQIAA